jgi:hypothetical protein
LRDEAAINDILRLLRDLWLRAGDVSVCQLIHSAVDPAVPNEICETSDAALLQQLRAMAFYSSDRSASPGVITAEHLAAMDEARDYDSASSYNWLNSELTRLRAVVRAGGVVRVEEESGPVSIASEAEFAAWAGNRYPSAGHG